MPAPKRQICASDVHDFMSQRCFAPCPQLRVAAEIEWLTFAADDARRDVEDLQELLSEVELPGSSAITFEPGGQIELSSSTFNNCGEALTALEADARVLHQVCGSAGINLRGDAIDAHRREQRVNFSERYATMEAFFDRRGPAGRTMMANTAAVHVNLDIGSPDELVRRWHLAHRVGPVLIALFANSPVHRSKPTGWRSTRMASWSDIDPSRTSAVDDGSDDPASTWADYAMGAELMLIRNSSEFVLAGPNMTFASWMRDGHELGWPDLGDLEYHLTTLFPPVRPRGWLELRMIDMLPDPWWKVAIAVTTAVMDDAAASEAAWRACRHTWNLWTPAAREALGHKGLREAAASCFDAALDALDRIGVDAPTIAAGHEFRRRYVGLGRTPADDVLDALREPTSA